MGLLPPAMLVWESAPPLMLLAYSNRHLAVSTTGCYSCILTSGGTGPQCTALLNARLPAWLGWLQEGETCHSEPFKVTALGVKDAMLAADRLGKAYLARVSTA